MILNLIINQKRTMMSSITLLITLFISPLLASSSIEPINLGGLSRPLIPPTSPRSPFYAQVLNANNITTTTTTTLTRAHYREWWLKASNTNNYNDSKYSKVYFNGIAGYVMDMYLGNPRQHVFAQFDTGSEMIWFQCEGQKGGKLPVYKQSKSSSYKVILCADERGCDTTVDEIICDNYEKPCGFKASYVDGLHANGVMATEMASLSTSSEFIAELNFGCSTNNSINTMGIIGAGNGEYSLPMQLYPNNLKFSYCISYDVTHINLVKFGLDADLGGLNIQILLNKNLPFYYIDVLSIHVNGAETNVPPYVYEMSEDGTRGFIIDSGTAVTHLTNVAFDALLAKVSEYLGRPMRYSGFEICYPARRTRKWPYITVRFPEFPFVLPRTGTWERQLKSDFVCLLIRRTDSLVSVLGYEQLYDVNVGYDLTTNKLHLRRTKCARIGQ